MAFCNIVVGVVVYMWILRVHERQLPAGLSAWVEGVTSVLAASQKYMRDQSVGKRCIKYTKNMVPICSLGDFIMSYLL